MLCFCVRSVARFGRAAIAHLGDVRLSAGPKCTLRNVGQDDLGIFSSEENHSSS